MRRRRITSSTADALRGLIAESYPPGTQLPPEAELSEIVGVSRGTLREALTELVLNGDVERKWGVGTFVREQTPTITLSLSYIQPLDQVLEELGRAFHLEVAEVTRMRAPAEIATFLDLESEGEVWYCERLIVVDGSPFALLADYVPVSIQGVPVTITQDSLKASRFLELIEDQIGLEVDNIEGVVTIPVMTDALRDRFRPVDFQRVLSLEQVVQAQGNIISKSTVYYSAENLRLSYARTSLNDSDPADVGTESLTYY